MSVRPWTPAEIDTLITLLGDRVSEYGFAVTDGLKSQHGGIALSLTFTPLGNEDIKTRTSGLVAYLKGLWGHPLPLKHELGVAKVAVPENYVAYGNDDNEVVLRRGDDDYARQAKAQAEAAIARLNAAAQRNELPNNWLDQIPEEVPFKPSKKGTIRYKYQFTRPDKGVITTIIY